MRLTITFLLLSFFQLNTVALPMGHFSSNCFPHGDGLKNSFKSELKITEERFEGKFVLYEGKGCRKQLLFVDYTADLNFPEKKNMGPLDKRVSKAYLVISDEDWRQRLNRLGRCGTSSISLNIPYEIQGHESCGPFPVPESGTILFDFFKRVDNGFSLGAYPLLWIKEEKKRPALTSRIVYLPKVPNSN